MNRYFFYEFLEGYTDSFFGLTLSGLTGYYESHRIFLYNKHFDAFHFDILNLRFLPQNLRSFLLLWNDGSIFIETIEGRVPVRTNIVLSLQNIETKILSKRDLIKVIRLMVRIFKGDITATLHECYLLALLDREGEELARLNGLKLRRVHGINKPLRFKPRFQEL